MSSLSTVDQNSEFFHGGDNTGCLLSMNVATERRLHSDGDHEVEAVDDSQQQPSHCDDYDIETRSFSRNESDGDSDSLSRCLPSRQNMARSAVQEELTNTGGAIMSHQETVPAVELPDKSYLEALPIAEAAPELPTCIALPSQPKEAINCNVVSVSLTSALTNEVAVEAVRLNPISSVDVRAGLICVKIFKQTKAAKLGITLQYSKEGHLQIEALSKLLDGSPLRPGDELLRLNGQNVTAWTISKAVRYLRERWGWISIVAGNTRNVGVYDVSSSLCQTSICKASQDDVTGVTFERKSMGPNNNDDSETNSHLCIRTLNVAGLLGRLSTIREGDIVQSVNHIDSAELNDAAAINIIRDAPDWVHIVVHKTPTKQREEQAKLVDAIVVVDGQFDDVIGYESIDESSIPVATEITSSSKSTDMDGRVEYAEAALVSVLVHKANAGGRLGISYARINNNLYITRIADGLLGNCILKEGMMILAVNNCLADKMTVSDITSYMKELVGPIRILACNPDGNPQYVHAMVYRKKQINETVGPVGISFRGSEGRQLKVCDLKNDGLFLDSCLNVGDSISRINGIACDESRPKEAVDIILSNHKCVTILARRDSKTAVVVAQSSTNSVGGLVAKPRTA